MGTTHRTRTGILGMVACLIGLLVTAAAPGADADPAITVTWPAQQRTLADGRTYWVRAPVCQPVEAPECVDFLGKARAVVVWFHHAFGAEGADAARATLELLGSWSPGTIFVFGVSRDGSRVWDAETCCARTRVDELGYLERVIDDVAARWTVARARVGTAGMSNGGMLAERAACKRPDLVAAASSVAGTFGGACDIGVTQIGQWHGADDPAVPLSGGSVWFNGANRTFPPAAELGQRMVRGSVFELRVRPDYPHWLPLTDIKQSVLWVVARLLS